MDRLLKRIQVFSGSRILKTCALQAFFQPDNLLVRSYGHQIVFYRAIETRLSFADTSLRV